MASKGFADRLYRGEANLNIVGRRRTWFLVAAVLVLLSVGSFVINGFELGIDFVGGTEIQVSARVGNQQQVTDAVQRAMVAVDPKGQVATTLHVGTKGSTNEYYIVRATPL